MKFQHAIGLMCNQYACDVRILTALQNVHFVKLVVLQMQFGRLLPLALMELAL